MTTLKTKALKRLPLEQVDLWYEDSVRIFKIQMPKCRAQDVEVTLCHGLSFPPHPVLLTMPQGSSSQPCLPVCVCVLRYILVTHSSGFCSAAVWPSPPCRRPQCPHPAAHKAHAALYHSCAPDRATICSTRLLLIPVQTAPQSAAPYLSLCAHV